jgi:anti-sigma B factor antagonist
MPYMNCPRCGLSIRLRAAYLALERCPRCIAKASVSVPMSISERSSRERPPERSTTSGRAASETRGVRQATSPGELVITIKREDRALVLELVGELDLASAPVLERQLQDAEGTGFGRVVVDLGGLEFFDSSGLHLLLSAQERLRENGQELTVRRGTRAVQRVFELTHTASIFRFED